jgi:twitching motility protein PilJ
LGQSIIVYDDDLQNFLANSSDPVLKAAVVSELKKELRSRKLEFATLVGSDTKILAGANVDRTGQVFDPSGIVTDVLNNNRRIVVTTLMSNADFRLEQAPRWL